MKDTISIYALQDPRTGESRYIGKTISRLCNRLARHCRDAIVLNRTHSHHWIKSLLNSGLRPKIILLATFPTQMGSFWERIYIAAARKTGINLTNHSDGGDGTPGFHPSNETREKLRKAALGNKRALGNKPNLGKKASPETRLKMSLAHKGRGKGQRLSMEHKAKLSAAKLGKPWTPARRAAQKYD